MLSIKTMKKAEKIRQLVELKQVMRRWRALSFRRSSASGSNRPVRAGFVAVYVGQERCRFVIPTRFLNLPMFASLLERAEEEYGFQPAGGLTLPCDVCFFRWILEALKRNEGRFREVSLESLMQLFSELGQESSSCKDELAVGDATGSYSAFAPLLHKARV